MKKKILKISMISVAVFLISALLAFGILMLVRSSNVKETGNVLGISWYNESDSEFTISTVDELYEFAKLSDFYNFEKQTIKLGADIVINEGNAEDWITEKPQKRWTPITKFAGTFDGQGHSISGLYGKAFGSKMALFLDTTSKSTIQNVKLINSYFESDSSQGTASFVAGGGGKLLQLYSDAIIHCDGENAGGIASFVTVQSTFEECWFDGNIQITSRNCGGVIARIDGARVNMKHCLFSGSIECGYVVNSTRVGGLCGRIQNMGSMAAQDCLSSGRITALNKDAGGSIGNAESGTEVSIRDVYCVEETFVNVLGGISGKRNGNIFQLEEAKMIGIKGYQWTTLDFERYWSAVEEGTPILKCFATSEINVAGVEKAFDISWYNSASYEFEISNLQQLYGLYYLSNSNDFSDKVVKLIADIICNDGKAAEWAEKAPLNRWYPIMNFAGTFDGQGHIISGIYVKSNLVGAGLFGTLATNSLAKNFSIKNSYLESSAKSLGSVAGILYGDIDTIYSDAIIVSSTEHVGGLVGTITGTTLGDSHDVKNCWFNGSVTAEGAYVGGLVGNAQQGTVKIQYCLNSGTVTSTYKSGYAGGILGGMVSTKNYQMDVTLENCLNVSDMVVSATSNVGSLVGACGNQWATLTFKNTYTTNCISHVDKTKKISNYTKDDNIYFGLGKCSGNLNGIGTQLGNAWLVGENAYQFTELDFAKYWTIVESDTPILQSFAGKVINTANIKKITDTSWYSAEKKEFIINTEEELFGFAVLATSNSFKGQTVKLGKSIAVSQKKWLPIGTGMAFAGTFDGQGKTISGIQMDTEQQISAAGLFGGIGSSGVVKNFRLVNSTFNGNIRSLGSVAGICYGDIESVYSNATVNSTTEHVGGLVGTVSGNTADGESHDIKNCWFDGSVTGDGVYVGGIVGNVMQGTAKIQYCLSSGTVTSNCKDGYAGGIVGGMTGGTTYQMNVTVENCLNTSTVTAKITKNVGSLVGTSNGKKGDTYYCSLIFKDVYTTTGIGSYKKDGITYVGLGSCNGKVSGNPLQLGGTWLVGGNAYKFTELDFANYWAIVENDTPVLLKFADAKNVLSPDDFEKMVDTEWYDKDKDEFVINTEEELFGFAMLATSNSFKDQTVKLGESIAVSQKVWLPIGTGVEFAGTFDGQGKTISGIQMDTEQQIAPAGLFGSIASSGVVKNFRLENSTFNGNIRSLGSVAGICYGDIESVYSNATVNSTTEHVGGLVGTVSGNTADGESHDIINCWFDGSVTGDGVYVGGIVGNVMQGTAKIQYCLSSGTVTSNCKDGYAGGIVGGMTGSTTYRMNVTVENCLNTSKVETKINKNVGSLVGTSNGKKDDTYYCSLIFKDVYTKNGIGSYKKDGITYVGLGSCNGKVSGTPLQLGEEWLVGENAYKFTELDFANHWAIVENGTPVLLKFAVAENVLSTDGIKKMVDTEWYDKDEDEFVINKEEELFGFAMLATSNSFKDQTVKLGKSIEVNQKVWLPIGTGTAFAGTFDGDGNTISGVHLVTSQESAGLFGTIASTGTVKNLRLEDSYFSSNNKSLGSIAGSCYGDIESIYSNAKVISTGEQCGGLIGTIKETGIENESLVANCWFDGTVQIDNSNAGPYCGGIIGNVMQGYLNMEDCLSTGSVISNYKDGYTGGLIGGFKATNGFSQDVTLKNCLNASTISASSVTGSVIGIAQNTGTYVSTLKITNVYTTAKESYANDAKKNGYIGFGHLSATLAEDSEPTAEVKRDALLGSLATGELKGFEFNNPEGGWVTRVGDVPALRSFAKIIPADTSWFNETQGTENNPYILKDADDLYGLIELSASNAFEGKFIQLTDNIEINPLSNGESVESWADKAPDFEWMPIGNKSNPFAGTFDGQGHTISGVYMDSSQIGSGLFGTIATTGTVKNLRLEDSYFSSTAQCLGSIAGICYGDISDIYSEAFVYGTKDKCGGIIGSIKGNTSDDFNEEEASENKESLVSNCWFEGTVSATDVYCGGIIGHVCQGYLKMKDCLNTGTVVADKGFSGGLIGGWNTNDVNATLTNCLNASDTTFNSEATNVGSLIGIVASSSSTIKSHLYLYGVYITSNDARGANGGHVGIGNAHSRCTVHNDAIYVEDEMTLRGDAAKDTLEGFEFNNPEGGWVTRTDDVPIPRSIWKQMSE